ncbi:MAG TPA: GTPase Era [Cytophagales bacterium]|nr:GTPase Era [Cytophagales bacterium]
MEQAHKAGFVSIIGKPNVGKSTLMNAMVGERLSIITSKAQTTRHRIMGILNGEHFQIVYSDTPGILDPQYELHKYMMKFVHSSLEDADIVLLVKEINEKVAEEEIFKRLRNQTVPLFILLNKVDLSDQIEIERKMEEWKAFLPAKEVIPVSALNNYNVDKVFNTIVENLPVHPAYYPKDELTDKPERFFAAEIIREKIFLNYSQEIPYSSQVVILLFKESEDIIRISAEIYVERESQKGILIGKGGASLKKVGTQARKELETFFNKKVFLEQFVKVEPDWRKNEKKLRQFGFDTD